jgi:hypothetical protein
VLDTEAAWPQALGRTNRWMFSVFCSILICFGYVSITVAISSQFWAAHLGLQPVVWPLGPVCLGCGWLAV